MEDTAADEVQRAIECPICFDDLGQKEIYQCPNGHILCMNCHNRKSRHCHTCRIVMPKRAIRNRALEFIASNESVRRLVEAPNQLPAPAPGQPRRSKRPLPKHEINCDSPSCKKAKIEVIQGVRFKCVQCPKYDLCETCVRRTHKHHLFVRIPEPEQAQLADRCKYEAENVGQQVPKRENKTFIAKARDRFVNAFRFFK